MADEDDRKWLPPTDPDDDQPGDTLPGVPGSFSGGPDVPGTGPGGGSGLSSGDPLGGGSSSGPSPSPSGGEGGGLWSSQPGQTPPSGEPAGQGGWGPPSQGGPPPQSPPPPGGGWGPPPAQQQTFAPYQQQSGQTNNKATAALVLGIVGLVLCPLICSVLALIFGYQARGEIDRSGGRQSGRGLATGGIVTGWIGVILSALGILLLILGVLASDDFDTSDDNVGRPAILLAARVITLLPV